MFGRQRRRERDELTILRVLTENGGLPVDVVSLAARLPRARTQVILRDLDDRGDVGTAYHCAPVHYVATFRGMDRVRPLTGSRA